MNNIKTFDQYLRDKYFKLSEKDKEYLLELDKKYGELAIIFRKEFRAKNVMNLDDEFDKFIEHKRVGEKYFKLSKKDKEYLLELDKKYGELAIFFRKEFRAKNVMNLDDEFDKFIEHKKVGEKYFPKLELEQIESSIDIKAEFEEHLSKFENFSSFISKFYIERINGFLKTIRLKEKYKEMTESGEYGKKRMKKK